MQAILSRIDSLIYYDDSKHYPDLKLQDIQGKIIIVHSSFPPMIQIKGYVEVEFDPAEANMASSTTTTRSLITKIGKATKTVCQTHFGLRLINIDIDIDIRINNVFVCLFMDVLVL